MHLHAKPRYLDVLRQNAEKNKHEFYDLYELRPAKHSSAQDRQQRDSAVWAPRLSGDVAVVQDDRGNTLLLCRSGIPHLTSELVHALRSDLPPDTTCETFAASKEVWFLAGVAQRNRLHLLARLADELGVDIARTVDALVHEDWPEDVRDLAVETYGVVLEDLVVDAEHARVVHRKGCVPVRAGMPAVPVWLGAGQGCVLWKAPPHVREMDGALLPCVPLRVTGVGEARGQLKVQDVQLLLAYQQLDLEAEQERCLEALDGLQQPVFHAQQPSPPLPLILCPHTPLTFTQSLAHAEPSKDVELTEALCSGLVSLSMEGAVRLQVPSPLTALGEERTLVWDAELEAVLGVVLDVPVEHMKGVKLRLLASALQT